VTDLRLDFSPMDACETYEARLVVNVYGTAGMFTLRLAPDWIQEVVRGSFETRPTTVTAPLPRAPLGERLVRVFLKHSGSNLYSYGLRLELFALRD
jgi:hypothetical protein